MGASGGPNIVNDDLIVHLDCGDLSTFSSGSLIWSDLSGNKHSGSLNDGTIGTDSGSINVMAFNGEDHHITVDRPDRSDGAACTQECWWQSEECLWNALIIENTYYAGYTIYPDGHGYHIYVNDGDGSAELNRGSQGARLYSTGSDGRSDFQHFCTTFESGNLTLYINGELEQTNTSVTANSPSTNTTHLGGDTVLDHRLKGNIAIYRHYHKALTAEEVKQNYDAQKNRFRNLNRA